MFYLTLMNYGYRIIQWNKNDKCQVQIEWKFKRFCKKPFGVFLGSPRDKNRTPISYCLYFIIRRIFLEFDWNSKYNSQHKQNVHVYQQDRVHFSQIKTINGYWVLFTTGTECTTSTNHQRVLSTLYNVFTTGIEYSFKRKR